MTETDERSRYATVTAGARVFALVALAAPVAFTASYGPILTVVLLAAVWMGGIFVEGMERVPVMPALVVESSLVTFLVAITLADSAVLLPAVVVPTFVGAMVRGSRGMLEVLFAQAVVFVATMLSMRSMVDTAHEAWLVFTWLTVATGFGSVAAIVHNLRTQRPASTTSSYREARELIAQLLDLSGELVDGLDPVSISRNVVDLVHKELPLTGAVVYAVSSRGVTPMIEGDVSVGEDDVRAALVQSVLDSGQPDRSGARIAFPLTTEAGVVGVVVGALDAAAARSGVHDPDLGDLSRRLRAASVQLDTALLFSSIREEATAEERRRLARDLHDGVAQDLAALGYLIDDITDAALSETVVTRAGDLRGELTRVVAELRQSIFSLRSEATSERTLGESIRSLAAHLESRSGITIGVELEEGPTRLRPDVEAELLRIAQEAMNNAVKHARANRIVVRCTVDAPSATVEVVDDGRGLRPGRDDSHGLRIMRERARRIGAALELHSPEGKGTHLHVQLAARGDAGLPRTDRLSSRDGLPRRTEQAVSA